MLFYQKILNLRWEKYSERGRSEVGSSDIKECSVFPNGQIINNDRLVELIEVVYDLLLSHDGNAVLYLLLYKIRFRKLSIKYPRLRKTKDYRSFINEELGFFTSRGSIPRDVKNTLLYLDEANNLFEKLHLKLLEGKKFSHKMTLSLDQYDPKTKTTYPSKYSWKATTDEDFRKKIGESTWKFLNEIGGTDD